MGGSVVQLTERDGLARFEVHAKPRARKSRVIGGRDTGTSVALEVAIAAPPVDGAANEELVRVLAEALGVPKRLVQLLRGEGSTKKLVGVGGLSAAEVLARLAAASEGA